MAVLPGGATAAPCLDAPAAPGSGDLPVLFSADPADLLCDGPALLLPGDPAVFPAGRLPSAPSVSGPVALLPADALPGVVPVLRVASPADLLCDGFPDILLMLIIFQGANLQLINGFLPDLFRTFAVG